MAIVVDVVKGVLGIEGGEGGEVFGDKGYVYFVAGFWGDGRKFAGTGLRDRVVKVEGSKTTVTGIIEGTPILVRQVFTHTPAGLEESITFENTSDQTVRLDDVQLGFLADLRSRLNWRLVAIPFRVQMEGPAILDYSGSHLAARAYQTPVSRGENYVDDANLTEQNIIRSEAWAWSPPPSYPLSPSSSSGSLSSADRGIVIMKYNNCDIELSVAGVDQTPAGEFLRFGGAGLCLFGEPSGVRQLAAGAMFTFGTTFYQFYEGGLNEAFYAYRRLLESFGHGHPADYNPPVNWNELYDVGWYHSNREELQKHYTRENLMKEAQKARDCHCELLYLDPGWEVGEGSTLWDVERLGTVDSFVKELREKYDLELGYRSILRDHTHHWPGEMAVRHNPADLPAAAPVKPPEWQRIWPASAFKPVAYQEICFCNPAYQEEKLKRILAISRQGVRFMMIDEFDWRGPCYHPEHHHALPTTPADHVKAVYKLCKEIRKACPDLTIECHDPIWPWIAVVYVPTYFQQGFGERGSYDENWGFEYMWNVIDDLRSGKAASLYYYNLGCSIPLYLHISMGTDNDNCVFFWWAASTIRHLGIGGKSVHPSAHWGTLKEYDREKRFAAYREQMAVYQSLKAYFVRGVFHGLSEDAHLHTLPGEVGGVLNVFNLTDDVVVKEVLVPAKLLGGRDLKVEGATGVWEAEGVRVRVEMAPMSPAVVRII